ncbi:Alpha/Beta hydrolase protein [Trichoderma sp. SZMC 28011]
MAQLIDNISVLQAPLTSIRAPGAQYNGLDPATRTLPAGFQKTSSHRPFRAATIFEQDIEIPLRDGVVIRADVFRPADINDPVPALVVWSPYGKSGTGYFRLDIVPGRVGVPQSRLSGFESFEGPDPAEWTARGYAIVNVNSRGSYDSQGDVRWFGSGEGHDGYDTIEHLARLPWCSGKIAMVGNSWLAMAQWHIAAQNPPHLTCFAPLEGCSDFYRESLCRGGVPYLPFWGFLGGQTLFGRSNQEDVIGMLEKYPRMNAYWEDKRAKIEQITIPCYVLASYSTGLHTVGSFRGFEDLPTDNKWLRVHPTQEWHDLYSTSRVEDLQLFFDYFLKLKPNGWEKSPKVLLSMLRYNKEPEYNHVFTDFPVPRTEYRIYYLCQDGTLAWSPDQISTTLSYQSDVKALQMDSDSEELSFDCTLPADSYLVGYSKAVLYMSCPDHDDLDVFVQIRKADSTGKVLQNINIPLHELGLDAEDVTRINTNVYIGPMGILRASRRKIDVDRSKPHWALHSHDEDEKISPGTIVKLEIGIWPSGIKFEKGEKLVFKVSGHDMRLAEFEPLRGKFTTSNKGRHFVHMGADYPSYVQVPFIKV